MKSKFIVICLLLILHISVFSQMVTNEKDSLTGCYFWKSQIKEHNFSIGSGFVQTMNTSSLYSGLRGINTSFDYGFLKNSKKYAHNFWGIFTEGNFDFLLTNEPKYMQNYYPDFYRAEFAFGGMWLWQLPNFIKNMNIYAGTGLSFNSELNLAINKGEDYLTIYSIPDLNWYISPDLHIRAEYNLRKVKLQGELSLPVAMMGNYLNQFHYLPVNMDTASIAKYKFTPNTFTFLHQIFQPTIKLSVQFPLKKTDIDNPKWYFQIKYIFESLDINLKYYEAKKEQHSIRLGFAYKM
ncbi:MAG: hypothetical protein LBT04_07285 [Prevotellaceae bacterium]|nr:hypothetical protein [Prevotellaceae bacterium]